MIFLNLIDVISMQGRFANDTTLLALDHYKNVIPKPLNPFPKRKLLLFFIPSLRDFVRGVFISDHNWTPFWAAMFFSFFLQF
jgi:hypothetical protein